MLMLTFSYEFQSPLLLILRFQEKYGKGQTFINKKLRKKLKKKTEVKLFQNKKFNIKHQSMECYF